MEKNEEDLDVKEFVRDVKKIQPNTLKKIMVICLFFLLYQLGFIYGFNNAHQAQEDYYEEKMALYCICRDTISYGYKNFFERLDIVDIDKMDINISNIEEKK